MKFRPIYLFVPVLAFLVYVFAVPERQPVASPQPAAGQEPEKAPEVFYWTSPGIEPDTCVTAWLLTRYVTPGARIEVREDPPAAAGAVPFDIPGCALQREPGSSTSDKVLEIYSIEDSFAEAVTAVVRELELAPWSTNDDAFFIRVRMGLADAVNVSESDEECIDTAMAFLDGLRKEVGENSP